MIRKLTSVLTRRCSIVHHKTSYSPFGKSTRHVSKLVGDVARKASNAMLAQAMQSKLEHSDVSQDTNIWLSPASVDTPTTSILEPGQGYATSDRELPNLTFEQMKDFPDPFDLVANDIDAILRSIQTILGTDNPVLSAVAKYFFEGTAGKMVRPCLVLLVAKAADAHRRIHLDDSEEELLLANQAYITQAQQRLAEITEMIHTASLLHDDVIDEAEMRRGRSTANKVFGDKLSILAGDFLLARSSICLARLRNLEVIELMSSAIEHLVKGEVMQMRTSAKGDAMTPFEYYMRKNYYKTGSLMANSCQSAAVLGKHSEDLCLSAHAYGRHIGLAFQLIDDYLDYKGAQSGKPLLADLKAGIATAPVLLAQETFPELKQLAFRKFAHAGDVELAADWVKRSGSLEQTKALATEQARFAVQAAMQFNESLARNAMVNLAHIVVSRNK